MTRGRNIRRRRCRRIKEREESRMERDRSIHVTEGSLSQRKPDDFFLVYMKGGDPRAGSLLRGREIHELYARGRSTRGTTARRGEGKFIERTLPGTRIIRARGPFRIRVFSVNRREDVTHEMEGRSREGSPRDPASGLLYRVARRRSGSSFLPVSSLSGPNVVNK